MINYFNHNIEMSIDEPIDDYYATVNEMSTSELIDEFSKILEKHTRHSNRPRKDTEHIESKYKIVTQKMKEIIINSLESDNISDVILLLNGPVIEYHDMGGRCSCCAEVYSRIIYKYEWSELELSKCPDEYKDIVAMKDIFISDVLDSAFFNLLFTLFVLQINVEFGSNYYVLFEETNTTKKLVEYVLSKLDKDTSQSYKLLEKLSDHDDNILYYSDAHFLIEAIKFVKPSFCPDYDKFFAE